MELGEIMRPLQSKPTPVQTVLVSATMAKVRRAGGVVHWSVCVCV